MSLAFTRLSGTRLRSFDLLLDNTVLWASLCGINWKPDNSKAAALYWHKSSCESYYVGVLWKSKQVYTKVTYPWVMPQLVVQDWSVMVLERERECLGKKACELKTTDEFFGGKCQQHGSSHGSSESQIAFSRASNHGRLPFVCNDRTSF